MSSYHDQKTLSQTDFLQTSSVQGIDNQTAPNQTAPNQTSLNRPRVTLIIPAYNEAQRLPATLRLYAEALREKYGSSFELLVVCNGCVDETAAVARRFAADCPELSVVVIEEAVGKGGAVLEGFRIARGREVAFADADAATSPASLLALYDDLSEHDVVIGSRRLGSSVITEAQPLIRRFLGWGFASAVRTLFGMRFADTQCGAKAFHQDAARELANLVTERRWAFDVDLLLRARDLGLRVIERPVVWADREGSQLRASSTFVEVVSSLWRLRIQGRVGAQTFQRREART